MRRAAVEKDIRTRPGWLLWQLSHSLEQLLSIGLGELGLTLTSFGALQLIATTPGSSTADLARQSLVTPQNMSVTIARLVRDGRVSRQPHEVHGRVQRLELTVLGRAALKEAWRVVLAGERQMLSDLSHAQAATLSKLMARSLGSLRRRKD